MTQEQWSPEPVALKIARLTISASIAESLIRLDGQATPPRRRPQTEPPARYTEDDIARMEALGVGNLDTAGALMLAYEQNRYPGAPRIGFKNHSLGYDLGTDEELRAWAAEAEKVLKTKPRDYDARVKRLEALSGLKARALVRENHRGPSAGRTTIPSTSTPSPRRRSAPTTTCGRSSWARSRPSRRNARSTSSHSRRTSTGASSRAPRSSSAATGSGEAHTEKEDPCPSHTLTSGTRPSWTKSAEARPVTAEWKISSETKPWHETSLHLTAETTEPIDPDRPAEHDLDMVKAIHLARRALKDAVEAIRRLPAPSALTVDKPAEVSCHRKLTFVPSNPPATQTITLCTRARVRLRAHEDHTGAEHTLLQREVDAVCQRAQAAHDVTITAAWPQEGLRRCEEAQEAA